jgi:hypothetical protein
MSANVVTLPIKAPNPGHSTEAMSKRREFVELVDKRMAILSEDRSVAEDIIRAGLIQLDNMLAQKLRERQR